MGAAIGSRRMSNSNTKIGTNAVELLEVFHSRKYLDKKIFDINVGLQSFLAKYQFCHANLHTYTANYKI